MSRKIQSHSGDQIFSTAIKVNLLKVLVGTVLFIFTLGGVNTVFAADGRNVNSNSNTSLVQRADDNTLIEHVAGFLFSLITPKDACAAAVIVDCREYCQKWAVVDDIPCCQDWKANTSLKCKTVWECTKEQAQ